MIVQVPTTLHGISVGMFLSSSYDTSSAVYVESGAHFSHTCIPEFKCRHLSSTHFQMRYAGAFIIYHSVPSGLILFICWPISSTVLRFMV